MQLVILGAPGVGKGTQAKRLQDRFKILHISTGDILRDAVRGGKELGKTAKGYMDRGELVPDDVIIGIIRDRIARPDCANGFILDGFPRTIPQAEALESILAEMHLNLDAVLEICIDPEKMVERLANRRVCRNCGAVFNLITYPPPADGKCPKCGGEIIQRDDDKDETVRNRLAVYEKLTAPLKRFYAKKGLLKTINGDDTIENVYEKILKKIGPDFQ
ncbi:adenylate kinase [bacterium BMS3Bbin03]|nr:adenylate kinase [bacterium BMS3Bbin03]HDZ12087.1 adenylate kinase [Bacteroidota bacterium]